MTTLVGNIEALILQALQQVTGNSDNQALLVPCRDEKHGDYQCNAAMGLAKQMKQKPRDIAEKIAASLRELDTQGLFQNLEIAGPGFINITLNDQAVTAALANASQAPAKSRPGRVVIDYSSPNIAKQMHVGHLRSSIIGDAIARILEYLGYEVVRQNHVGDWGTQFGLLCAWIMDRQHGLNKEEVDLSDLEAIYRESQALAEVDPVFREKSRARVVALHSGDAATLEVWRYIVDKSLEHIDAVYKNLGVSLSRRDMCGESFYNPRLADVVSNLQQRFPAGSRPMEVKETQGAICVFLYDEAGQPRYKNPEGEPLPFLIRKSDGAFLYPTTDLAALRYRVGELKADWLVYVTDSRQALHFNMLFETSRQAGWAGEAKLEHITFGTVLGEDGKPLKTRAGKNVKLADLLEEAVAKAGEAVRANGAERGFSEEEMQEIAQAVGIGAVKYADLSQNRASDYVFSFDRMLALEGNTAPYLLYAYARIRSIERKAQQSQAEVTPLLNSPQERRLALQLARFGETLEQVASGWRLNLLCEYLYGLAGLYMKFYENCPVLNADDEQVRNSRLVLCRHTAEVLKAGLALLGIHTVEKM